MSGTLGQISSLQWRKATMNDGTFTDSNSLVQALYTKPEIYNTMAYANGDKFFSSFITAGLGKLASNYKALGNAEYIWPLMGDITKPIQIAESNTRPQLGLGFQPFQLVLAEKYFFEGCVVKFQDSDIQARVASEPYALGNCWVYTFVIVGNDPTIYVPASDCEAGKYLAVLYTAYEEGSKGGGSFEAHPMWFQNQMTIMRMSYGMTGSAATDKMILELGREGGAKHKLWINASEYQKMMLWERQLEYYRFYGKYNKTPNGEIPISGANGRPVRIGAGMLDQIATCNTWEVNSFSADVIESMITSLQIASKEAENSKILLVTGTAGKRAFNDAILSKYKSFNIVDTTFVTKSGAGLTFNSNNFTTYKGILGTEVTVAYNPMFDDRSVHTAIDPETGLPKESSRMVFLNIGDFGGESNISMVTKGEDGKNRSLLTWYTAGSTSPGNPMESGVKSLLRSSDFDGFQCHFLSEQGIKITNPLSCGQIQKV